MEKRLYNELKQKKDEGQILDFDNITHETLYQLWREELVNDAQIAELYGVKRRTVSNRRYKWNIKQNVYSFDEIIEFAKEYNAMKNAENRNCNEFGNSNLIEKERFKLDLNGIYPSDLEVVILEKTYDEVIENKIKERIMEHTIHFRLLQNNQQEPINIGTAFCYYLNGFNTDDSPYNLRETANLFKNDLIIKLINTITNFRGNVKHSYRGSGWDVLVIDKFHITSEYKDLSKKVFSILIDMIDAAVVVTDIPKSDQEAIKLVEDFEFTSDNGIWVKGTSISEYDDLKEKIEEGEILDFESIDYFTLYRLWYEESVHDNLIAELYNVPVSKVKRKRNKWKINFNSAPPVDAFYKFYFRSILEN